MKNKILLLGFLGLVLAGCATSTRYVNYTDQRFTPKDKFYDVLIYPDPRQLASTRPYYVIGKVSVEGLVSNGVGPESLTNEAKVVARKKGADGIINTRTDAFRYYGGDELLRFKGDLIVFVTPATKP